MNPHLTELRPYPFERLRTLLAGVQPPSDRSNIALYIGEPRHPPPAFVIDELRNSLNMLGSYPATLGLLELRTAIAAWLTRRFQLRPQSVNAETMILPVNGTREALFAFVQAAVDSSRSAAVLMPNPFYQIYEGAALLAAAEPVYLNADRQNGYQPDLDAIPASMWNRCQVLFLCSPNNPTGKVLPIDYLQHALTLADKYDFVIAADECYSEIYVDEARPPVGLLQAAQLAGRDNFERCVVFHSLSKRSSVPGLRSGFVAGDPQLIKPYLLYRTYHGNAMSVPTQRASALAWSDENHVIENRRLYREKFREVLAVLNGVMDVGMPEAAFYLWPDVGDDERFTRDLFAREHITVLPGSYLSRENSAGNPGRGRVRISLVASVSECVEAAQRIRRFVAKQRL